RAGQPNQRVTVVADTSVLVDHLRGDSRALDLLSSAFGSGERVAASVLTRLEILAGMRSTEELSTEALLDLIDWIPVDMTIADRAGRLGRQYLSSPPGVDPTDLVIAA